MLCAAVTESSFPRPGMTQTARVRPPTSRTSADAKLPSGTPQWWCKSSEYELTVAARLIRRGGADEKGASRVAAGHLRRAASVPDAPSL